MLRRSFLTTALAAPALLTAGRAAAQCYPIEQGPGSSVAPISRTGAARAAGAPSIKIDPCGGSGIPAWMPLWPAGTRQAFDAEAVALANYQPLPSNTLVVSSPYSPILTAQLTPGQYSDVTELLTWWAGGAIASGVSRTGSGQYAFSNWAGIGVATAAWIGWNTGTFIYLNGAQVDLAIRNVGLGPWMMGLSSSQGDALRAQIGSGGGVMIIRLR